MMRARTVLGLGLLFGCRAPTEMAFVVTTDLTCDHVNSTALAVGTLADFDTRPFTATSASCINGTLGTLIIVPGNDKQIAVRIVTGLDGMTPEACVESNYSGGCIVARRSLGFVASSRLDVQVKMEASCRDIVCQATETCAKGACAPIAATCNGTDCTPSTPTPPSRWVAMRAGKSGGVAGRADHSAVWTGHVMLVFGGADGGGTFDDGGAYDPRADTWQVIQKGPLQTRLRHVAVWTGSEMIIWGGGNGIVGALADGARFDPKTSTWNKVSAAPNAFSKREQASGVWAPTTGELIIWGGIDGANTFNTGAAYNARTDQWRMIAPSPLSARSAPSAVWLGDRLLIFGGQDGEKDGALYSPKTDTWSPSFSSVLDGRLFDVAAWSGDPTEPVGFWGGGNSGGGTFGDGVTFEVGSKQFTSLPPLTLLPIVPRVHGGGWMSNHRLWMWGGEISKVASTKDGAYFDLASSTWSAMPTDGAPAARHAFTVVWTGTEAIVWGGTDTTSFYDDGALFTH